MKLTWLLLAVLTAQPVLTAQEVQICLCKPSPQSKEGILAERDESTSVFAGRVLRVVKRADGFVEVKLKVIESWKGVTTAEIVVTTPYLSEGNCGYKFRRGGRYLIYTHQSGKREREADTCTRTKKLSEAEEDLRVLGKGQGFVKGEGK